MKQVARGMMGPLIVEDNTSPDVDHDITVLLSDWRMQEDGNLVEDYTDMHSVAHAGIISGLSTTSLSCPKTHWGPLRRVKPCGSR